MRVPNNQELLANQIRSMFEVEVVADDGSVIVNSHCSEDEEEAIRAFVRAAGPRIGDGVQEGSLWINGEDC